MKVVSKVILLSFLAVLPLIVLSQTKSSVSEATSPDKTLKVTVVVKEGVPFYRLFRNNKPLLSDSRLGFVLKGQPAMDKDFKIVSSTPSTFDETWTQPWGEVKDIRNHYNSLVVVLEEQSQLKRKMSVEFRVYNDGIGFRYSLPQQENLKDFVILDE